MISEGYLNGYYINHIRRIVVAKDQRPQGKEHVLLMQGT